jgi:sulfatase maturation enzyme AslB (radical SAM superfamily)
MALLEERLRQEQNVREQQQTSRFEEIARLIRKLDAQEVLAQQASVRAEQDTGKIERLNHLLAEFKEAQVGQSVLLRRREGELEETRNVLQDLQAKLDERESRLTILEEEKRLLVEQFEAILKSSSWKLTAPIRKIVMTARRGR